MSDPTSMPNFPPPASEHPLRGRVLDAFHDDGVPADIDGDGDVSYQIEGQQLFVHCTEGDVPVMRVFGQWQIGQELPDDQFKQLQCANELSLRMNIVKVGMHNGTLVVTCEHIAPQDADVRGLLQLSTKHVLMAVQMWHQMMLGHDVFGDTPTQE